MPKENFRDSTTNAVRGECLIFYPLLALIFFLSLIFGVSPLIGFIFKPHQGLHSYAWDFVMPIGTKILAPREGTVLEVEQSFSSVGLKGNYLLIRHTEGQISGYFPIQKNGALVKVGDVYAYLS